MRRHVYALTGLGLLAAVGCHIGGKYDCDWDGWNGKPTVPFVGIQTNPVLANSPYSGANGAGSVAGGVGGSGGCASCGHHNTGSMVVGGHSQVMMPGHTEVISSTPVMSQPLAMPAAPPLAPVAPPSPVAPSVSAIPAPEPVTPSSATVVAEPVSRRGRSNKPGQALGPVTGIDGKPIVKEPQLAPPLKAEPMPVGPLTMDNGSKPVYMNTKAVYTETSHVKPAVSEQPAREPSEGTVVPTATTRYD